MFNYAILSISYDKAVDEQITYVHRLKILWQTAWLVLCFQLRVHFPPSHWLPLQIPVETEK